MSSDLKWLGLFSCICCGRQVARLGQLKCALCSASPKALSRVVEFHEPYTAAWIRLWRMLPQWQEKAKTYAYGRYVTHSARRLSAVRALKAQRGPITAQALDREIGRRETGCARMAARRIAPEAIREARQGIGVLREMRRAMYGERGGGENAARNDTDVYADGQRL